MSYTILSDITQRPVETVLSPDEFWSRQDEDEAHIGTIYHGGRGSGLVSFYYWTMSRRVRCDCHNGACLDLGDAPTMDDAIAIATADIAESGEEGWVR